jgi:thiamine pyrophosphokinase
MKAALCIGGEAPGAGTLKEILSSVDYIAAADSGFDYLYRLGYEPDLVVGDLDSTSHADVIQRLPKEKVELSERDKDETDAEIGLRRLHELGAKEIILIGGGGGRLDHLVGLLILFHRESRPDQWYSGSDYVVSIDRRREFSDMEGATVSLFPVGKGRCRLRSRGLKWPLDGLLWERGDAGISNVVTSPDLLLEPAEGRAIMICSSEVCRGPLQHDGRRGGAG